MLEISLWTASGDLVPSGFQAKEENMETQKEEKVEAKLEAKLEEKMEEVEMEKARRALCAQLRVVTGGSFCGSKSCPLEN